MTGGRNKWSCDYPSAPVIFNWILFCSLLILIECSIHIVFLSFFLTLAWPFRHAPIHRVVRNHRSSSAALALHFPFTIIWTMAPVLLQRNKNTNNKWRTRSAVHSGHYVQMSIDEREYSCEYLMHVDSLSKRNEWRERERVNRERTFARVPNQRQSEWRSRSFSIQNEFKCLFTFAEEEWRKLLVSIIQMHIVVSLVSMISVHLLKFGIFSQRKIDRIVNFQSQPSIPGSTSLRRQSPHSGVYDARIPAILRKNRYDVLRFCLRIEIVRKII